MGVSATWKKDSKRWEVTLRRDGNRRRRLAPHGYGKRQAIAEIGDALISEWEAEARLQPGAPPLTLWQFCAEVYQHHHGVSERTWRNRRYKVSGIMADLGDLTLPEVSTAVVREWLELLAADGAPLMKGGRGKPLKEGGSAYNDYLVALKAIYRIAVEREFVDAVPFRNRLAPIDLTTDREAWSPAMKKRLLDAARGLDPGIYSLAEFLMLSGCRPVEALRLRWEHVQDVPTPNVTIRGKGMRYRKLPLSGALGTFVSERPRSGAAVFPVEAGESTGGCYKFWPKKRWDAVCSQAQVPTVVYDLRHTFITEMVVKGVSLPMIAKWAGNSVRVIEERYSHLSPEFLKGVSSEVERVEAEVLPDLSEAGS